LRDSQHSNTLTLVPSDRRAGRRFTAGELQWLEHVRLQYGPSVSLVDLSIGGASFEAERPLRPGASTVLELDAEHEQRVVAGRIIRCEVVALGATSIRYRGACAFGRPLRWSERLATPAVSTPYRVIQPSAEQSASSNDWSEVLLAFLHGRFLKGYTRGFHPSRPILDILPSRTASERQAQKVPLSLLRTILFLRHSASSNGDVVHARVGSSRRTIEVTFKDNYVMVGTAPDYEEGTPGFMMRSTQLGDSMSVFVVSSAVRGVRFL
jgi:hypothetical protein